jgi:hypothetical protein
VRRLRIVKVKANNIEDVCCVGVATDEFYLAGKLSIGENSAPFLTKPVWIGQGEERTLNAELLSVYVPAEAAVHLAVAGFDQDAATVFADLPKAVQIIGGSCALVGAFFQTRSRPHVRSASSRHSNSRTCSGRSTIEMTNSARTGGIGPFRAFHMALRCRRSHGRATRAG